MTTHLFNKDMLPDDQFINGGLNYLIVGNECRLMDARRTPGVIRSIDLDGGFFRWEILDFEDKGSFWDVRLESVNRYQFKKESKILDNENISILKNRIKELDKKIKISATHETAKLYEDQILKAKNKALLWLKTKSIFFKNNSKIDFTNKIGPEELRTDFNEFMDQNKLSALEKKTSATQVLNPLSGDWICGVQIATAEMGLRKYSGPNVRSSKAFDGIGNKESIRKYVIHRLGFLRALFELLEVTKIALYRGMISENGFKGPKPYKFWNSWTFNYSVAQDFSKIRPNSTFKDSHLIKKDVQVEKLFMTFLETDAMNRQYFEAEALVLMCDDINF